MRRLYFGCWPNHLQLLQHQGSGGRHDCRCTIRAHESKSSHVNDGACVCVHQARAGVFIAGLLGSSLCCLRACCFVTFCMHSLGQPVFVTKVLVLVFAWSMLAEVTMLEMFASCLLRNLFAIIDACSLGVHGLWVQILLACAMLGLRGQCASQKFC